MKDNKLEDWCRKHRIFFIFILFCLGIALGVIQSLLLNGSLSFGLRFGFFYSVFLIATELSCGYGSE